MRRRIALMVTLVLCVLGLGWASAQLPAAPEDVDADGYNRVADCNDADPSIRPGAAEICGNGVDEDCDGRADDGGDLIATVDDAGRLFVAWWNPQTQSFGATAQVGTLGGGNARGVAVADFDNDGDLDVVAGRGVSGTGSYSLWVGEGCQTLSPRGEVATLGTAASWAMDMVAGDFDNDGNMDFLAQGDGNLLGLFAGDGRGNFHLALEMLPGANGRAMDAADFNHDGRLDFVRARSGYGAPDLFLGNGDGTFRTGTRVSGTWGDSYGIAAGDFDGDGHVDLMGNEGGSGDAYFYKGNGDGTFRPAVATPTLDTNRHGAFDAFDFDRDGDLDFVQSTHDARQMVYTPGNGNGTFGTRVVLGLTVTNALSIAAAPVGRSVGTPRAQVSPQSQTIGQATAAQPETCNGIDDDCDGQVDNAPTDVGTECMAGLGACARPGVWECSAGGRICNAVAGAPQPETCNNVDDDCDGVVDDNPGDAQGTCSRSVAACTNTAPLACVGGVVVCTAVQPVIGPELCNGRDDDCDGTVDDAPSDASRPCFEGLGECRRDGATVCDSGLLVCSVAAGAPQAELCNGRDDDCDGAVDDAPADAGQACTSGIGECKRDGVVLCDAGQSRCSAEPGAPAAESCNGKDDDCDGHADEGEQSCGQGLCRHTSPLCAGGQPVVCNPLQGAVAEECDGVDNDCDGTTDNGFERVACGVGACQHSVAACLGVACDPMEGAGAEQCNGIDDDCDGLVDDAPVDAGAACDNGGVGACRQPGVVICEAGATRCNAPAGQPALEICDTLDNDCDGQVDEERVCPDTAAPTVAVTLSASPIDPDQEVTIRVVASDDREVLLARVEVDGVELVLGADGTAAFSTAVPGPHAVVGFAVDAAGNEGSSAEVLWVRDAGDLTAPVVALTSPAEGAELKASSEVRGTASDANLMYYTLAYAREGSVQFEEFARGGASVVGGLLGTLPIDRLPNGVYLVRLEAMDVNAAISRVDRMVVINSVLKPGQVKFCVPDIEVQLSGVPIRIDRCYDSFDKRRNEFGVGWSLDLSSGYVTHNREMGRHWDNEPVCGQKLFGKCIDFQCAIPETAEHVTVTFTGGDRFFRFKPRIANPSLLDGVCLGTVEWVADPATPAGWSLVALENTDVWIFPGDTQLLQQFDFADFDPRRFELRGPDGQRIGFTQGAGINYVNDGRNNRLDFRNDGILHSSGLGVPFLRNAAGSITRITDPDGHAFNYEYDARGDLVAAVNRVGGRWTYTYDANHNLTGMVGPDGTPIQAQYDAQGRMTGFGLPNLRSTVDYALEARTMKITDRNGAVRTVVYDELGRVVDDVDAEGARVQRQFDANGRMTRQTSPEGNVTQLEYTGAAKLPTRVTSPRGHVHVNAFDASGRMTEAKIPDGRSARMNYAANGDPLSVVVDGQTVTEIVTNPSGNMSAQRFANGDEIQYAYDVNGRKTTVTYPDATTERYTYDGSGRVLTHTRRNGGVRRYTYDAEGRRTAETDPCGGTTRTDFNAQGRPVTVTDALGRVSRTEYDGAGRVSRIVHPDASEVHFTYDGEGHPVTEEYPGGLSLHRTYDSRGRVLTEEDSAGGVIRHTYNRDGMVVRTELPTGVVQTIGRDPDGNVASDSYPAPRTIVNDSNGLAEVITDALGNVSRYTYSYDGALRTETFADGSTRTFDVDGDLKLVGVTDEAGQVTRYVRDVNSRVKQVTLADGTIWRFQYTGNGRLASVLDPRGNTTTHQYDLCDRVTRTTQADGTSVEYTYDLGGNLTGIRFPDGSTVARTYDTMDRLVREVRSDGTESAWTHTAAGRVATYTDARGVTRFSYDAGARLIRVVQPDGATVQYTYDRGGRRTSVTATTPNGESVRHELDYHAGNGMLAAVRRGAEVLVRYEYDAAAHVSAIVYGNGTRTVLARDNRGRLIRMTTLSAGGATLLERVITRDVRGLTTAETDERGVERRYQYDAIQRLVREERVVGGAVASWRQYAYDTTGNLVTVDDHTGRHEVRTYDAANRMTAAGATQYTYDARGRMQRIQSGVDATQLTFDVRGQLTAIDGPGIERRYTYDHAGNRIGERTDGVFNGHVAGLPDVDPESPFRMPWDLADFDAQGHLVRSYVPGLQLHAVEDAAGRRYAHVDARGSIIGWTDAAGQLVSRLDYDAWGNLIEGAPDASGRTFLAAPYDAETRLSHLGAREYDASSGRFLSRDPVAPDPMDPRTFYTYVYGANSPVDYVDPSGKMFSMGGLMTGLSVMSTLISVASISYRLWQGEKVAWWEFALLGASCIVPVMQGSKLAYIIFSRGALLRDGGRWVAYQYTSAAGAKAIYESGKLIPGAYAGGKVWVTDIPPMLMFNKWVGWYYQMTLGAVGGKFINFGGQANTAIEAAVEFQAGAATFRSAKMLNQFMATGEQYIDDIVVHILH